MGHMCIWATENAGVENVARVGNAIINYAWSFNVTFVLKPLQLVRRFLLPSFLQPAIWCHVFHSRDFVFFGEEGIVLKTFCLTAYTMKGSSTNRIKM